MELFDSHLHLDDPAFAGDLDAVLARARGAGVTGMVTVGTDVASSRAAVDLSRRHPDVFAAVAVHPHAPGEATEQAMTEMRAIAAHPKVVAIGESGLDYARADTPREAQRTAFVRHIRLSRDLGLPLIIHCRDAYPAVLEILQREGADRVIMHAFAGAPDVAQECVRRGYTIALGGAVTFKNARAAMQAAREVPLASLLVETDAPVLTPEPFRGRRNEPAYLVYVAERIAALRGAPVDDVARATTANARRIFRVVPSGTPA